MQYGLRILLDADGDVDGAAHFIARDNLDAALRFYDAVNESYHQIQEHPKRWPRYELDDPRLADLRKRSVVGFDAYLIFYRIDADMVEIIRVLHGSRDIPSILMESL